jgi:hypothetical protein
MVRSMCDSYEESTSQSTAFHIQSRSLVLATGEVEHERGANEPDEL